MRVVLLRDPGELLEPDPVVLAGVLHAGLRERAGHQAGAEHALDRADRIVAAGRLVGAVAPRRRRDAEQVSTVRGSPGAGQ